MDKPNPFLNPTQSLIMTETPKKKSYLSNSKLKVYTVTAGEQRAKSSLSFNAWNGDFTFSCSIAKDADQKGDRGIYVAVGMDIFTAQMVLDAMRRAAETDGAFDSVTFITNGKSNWDPQAKRKVPGEIKNELTVFKKPNGVICLAFKDVAKDVKTAIDLIHPNRELYHNVLVNKEPITDAQRSKLLTLAMTYQLGLSIALESQRTYDPPPPFDPNNRGGNSGGYNNQRPQQSYRAPAAQAAAPAADMEEQDIPY